MKITFIGAGNMAEAIVAGMVDKKMMPPGDIFVTDISPTRLTHFMTKYEVSTSDDNGEPVAQSDVVVLSVKPQIFPTVWPEIEAALPSDALVISIMAGVPSVAISGGKPIRIVRVMPNTPALIGKGAAGLAAGVWATEADMKLTEQLLGAVGLTVRVQEEELHAVTAVSGSGPAYVFYLLEHMLAAAEQLGLDSNVARDLALETVIGAAELMKQSGEGAAELRHKVTSKGGTTAAAINALMERGVGDAIIEAMQACADRSKELADG